MPQEIVHRYVVAIMLVRAQRLVVEAEGHPWRTERSFPLKF